MDGIGEGGRYQNWMKFPLYLNWLDVKSVVKFALKRIRLDIRKHVQNVVDVFSVIE